ncbi:MAG: hypothetical protein QM601_06465 [Pseudoxanthomonas sp.]
MKHVASTVLIVLSTLLLGFYALIWSLAPQAKALTGHDNRTVLVHAIGAAGLAFAVLAFRELRDQRMQASRLKAENEEFV